VTDMFYAVAPNYIPNSEKLSDAQLQEVSRAKFC
jgi:hypothetical protein